MHGVVCRARQALSSQAQLCRALSLSIKIPGMRSYSTKSKGPIKLVKIGDPELDKKMLCFSQGDKKYFLLGTVHMKEESDDLVCMAIAKIKPDAAVLELPNEEYETEADEGTAKPTDPINWLLEFSRGVHYTFSIAPEICLAEKLMLEQNLPVVRADRDPVISLRRMVPYMSWIEKLNLIYRIISAKYFQANPMEAQKKVLDQVPFEDLWKDTEKVQGQVFGSSAMQLMVVHERDLVFIDELKRAPGKKILGVFGAAHLYGIKRFWSEDIDWTKKLHTVDEGLEESAELLAQWQEEVAQSTTSAEEGSEDSNKPKATVV